MRGVILRVIYSLVSHLHLRARPVVFSRVQIPIKGGKGAAGDIQPDAMAFEEVVGSRPELQSVLVDFFWF